eukprot:scaffold11910_cov104-Skeletonema_dohrnii-CCMP3373.AAC.2
MESGGRMDGGKTVGFTGIYLTFENLHRGWSPNKENKDRRHNFSCNCAAGCCAAILAVIKG